MACCMPWATITSNPKRLPTWKNLKPPFLQKWASPILTSTSAADLGRKYRLFYNSLYSVPWTMSEPSSPDADPRSAKNADRKRVVEDKMVSVSVEIVVGRVSKKNNKTQ